MSAMAPRLPDKLPCPPTMNSSTSGDAAADRFQDEQEPSSRSMSTSGRGDRRDDHDDDDDQCRAAEEWLSRGTISSSSSSSSLSLSSSSGVSTPPLTTDSVQRHLQEQQRYYSSTAASRPKSETARSSLSCPGKTSLRERLQRRLLREEQNNAPVVHPVDTWFAITKQAVPPPPPSGSRPSSPPQKSLDSRDDQQNATTVSTTEAVVKILAALEDSNHPSARAEAHASLVRLSRQVRYGRRGRMPQKANSIKLHIYDLLPTETIVQLGWGCEFPIGQCFNAVNDGLHALGTGAYHCGIEINGVEYAYGANACKGTTGVFSCIPRHSPGFEYRTSLDFGTRPLVQKSWARVGTSFREVVNYIDGRDVVMAMAKEYLGSDYDLWRRNCCTFARDACLRLGVEKEEIPTWFWNLADAGAATQDVLLPITSMLSVGEEDDGVGASSGVVTPPEEHETGFEVIAKRKEGSVELTELEIVRVVEAMERERAHGGGKRGRVGFRRTLSWTY